MEISMFINLILILISVVMCLLSLNLIHSVFWLTSSFITTSVFLMILGLYSIAVIVMIIYVGAIAIMFIFSVMMVDLINLGESIVSVNLIPLVLIFCLVLYFTSEYSTLNFSNVDEINYKSLSDLSEIGLFFFNNFSFFVLGCGIILLIPMVGALIFIKCLY